MVRITVRYVLNCSEPQSKPNALSSNLFHLIHPVIRNRLYNLDYGWGRQFFVKRDRLLDPNNGLLHGDQLVINCEVCLISTIDTIFTYNCSTVAL